MVYRIYNEELGTLTGYPEFETLDAWEAYLDKIADTWEVTSAIDEDTSYEVTFPGVDEYTAYLVAVLEDKDCKRWRLF